jgi:manganese transport protein
MRLQLRRVFGVALGILTAIGGFVEIGGIVSSSETGARYGMSLTWAVVVGVVGIMVFSEMCGRVAASSGRAAFDLVRERLGVRLALANLAASWLITLLTVTAELAGAALALELATGVRYLFFVPLVGVVVWWLIWRVGFAVLENLFGLLALALGVVAVALWRAHPDWGALLHQATHPSVPKGQGHPGYFFFAIALFGSAMTPYEIFFYSSGAVEDRWTRRELASNRRNVVVGFTAGGLLTLALMAGAAVVFQPRGTDVTRLSQAALPTVLVLGRLGFAVLLLGMVMATVGAAIEAALAAGYAVAQTFGWPWGKLLRPAEAARFHLVTLLTIVAAVLLALSTLDPIKLTVDSLVLGAASLPLTYLPILIVANDPDYLGEATNSGLSNLLGVVYLLVTLLVTVATVPLLVLSKGGG